MPRRLVTLTAPLEDLLTDDRFAAHADDWVSVEYTDDLPQREPLRRLQARFPYCAKVVHAPAVVPERAGGSYVDRVRAARSDRELVDAFLQHVRDGQAASEREAELLADVLDERTRVEALA